MFGVRAARAAAFFGKIIHRAVFVLIEPFFKNVVVKRRLRRSNASQDKSQLARFVFNGLLEVGQVDFRNGYDEYFYLTMIFTKMALPKGIPRAFAICQALVYSPTLAGALKLTETSISCPTSTRVPSGTA